MEQLHRTDLSYTPPFPGSVVKHLKSNSAYQRQHGPITAFLAWRNGQPVGRIAAIINRTHNAYHHDKVGFFGFFACEDNPETATALFQAAEQCLKEQGCEVMRGPYNPSINEDCGLLTSGFPGAPFISMPWNPPYYVRLLEHSGLVSVRELCACLIPLRASIPDRVERIMQRQLKRQEWRVRPIDLSNLDEEMKILHRLYNTTLDRNWGFVPISYEDLMESAADLKAMANPEVIIIAEKDGVPAGFALSLPNINQHLYRTRNTPHWLRLPHLLWLLKTERLINCRLAILGVAPEYRDRGISAMLFYEQFKRTQRFYEYAEISWIEANNEEILRNIEMMHGKKYRSYEIYEKPL